ncbi:Hint domain-containing protein [Nioella aestuarii]|uniref:Hint domain-containing protein n=1 Tax=Nioella aestuarii TaxID=1662864 RepID=UPI003D7FE25F
MASESYLYYYVLSGPPPGSVTLGSRIDNGLGDLIEADGAIDGVTAIGGIISWAGFSNPLIGFFNGDPILDFGGFGIYYLLSNDPSLANQTVSVTNTGSFAYCFAEGTEIDTPNGAVAVEKLAIGDTVLSAEGRRVPIKWIGEQTVATLFQPAERLKPVRFAAGSLGNGLPYADLTVTADHGMLVDGVICHAGALVNGKTITFVPLEEMGERYKVYHIETEEHEVILANGAPAETFIDNVSRRSFDNFAEFEALYGDVPEMAELPYPRAMSARQVPAAIKALLGSAEAA